MAVKKNGFNLNENYTLKNNRTIKIIEKTNDSLLKIMFIDNNDIIFTDKYSISKCLWGTGHSVCSSFIGDIMTLKDGQTYTIISIIEGSKRRIKFNDSIGYEYDVDLSNIPNGNIHNPYKKTYNSVGFLGSGKYNSVKNKNIYVKWSSMIERAYSKNFKKSNKAYESVTVCEEWHNFQNFAEWYENNYPKNVENIKLHLDKDLMQIGVESKIYSPETCVFLPQKINSFIASLNKKNRTDRIGVRKYNKKYVAVIKEFEGGLPKYLGSYDTLDDASNIYIKERKEQVKKAKKYLLDIGITDIRIHNALTNSYPKYGDMNGC